jgi:hypothetical protein
MPNDSGTKSQGMDCQYLRCILGYIGHPFLIMKKLGYDYQPKVKQPNGIWPKKLRVTLPVHGGQ